MAHLCPKWINFLSQVGQKDGRGGANLCPSSHEAKENKDLKQIQELSQKEIEKYDSNEIDICGNPHTVSQMERMVFLATQIVSILSFYNKHGKFKFDYVNYYRGMDDIIPTPLIGYLDKSHLCFCERESI